MSHITIAASEDAFRQLFAALRDAFSFADSNSGSFAGFTAGYSVAAHLEGGTVDLRADGTVQVKELDVKWDVLDLTLGFDIPELCIGGWCIIPNPFPWGDDCWVEFPKICVFSANPDVSVTIPLGGLITSEVSITGSLVTKYRIDPGRLAWMDDWDAQDAGVPNKWQVFLDPDTVDLDLFDIADIVGDLLMSLLTTAIEDLLPGPQWLKDAILAILGAIVDLIRDILDLPDDIGEWISDLLGVSLGLFNSIVNFVLDYFAAQNPIFEIEDPYPIEKAASVPTPPGLIPIKIPIRDFTIGVDDKEMTVTANVGP